MKKLLLALFTLFVFAFGAKAQDVGITSVISPVSGCCVGMDTVRLYLYNYSAFPIGGNFTITYTVNGGAPISETILTSIGPSASYLFGFNQQWNFACQGTYNVCCNVQFPGDVNPANNNFCVTIVSDTFVVAGTVSGPPVVCASANSGVMVLSGNNKNDSLLWQMSVDGTNWINTMNDSSSYQFSNIGQTMYYQVFVDGGYCPDGTSSVHTIFVDSPPVGGSITSNMNVCSGNNSAQLNLIGSAGDTIYWAASTGGGPYVPFVNDTTIFVFNNITQTTQYQAYVANGVCPFVPSGIVTVLVDPPTIPGTVVGGATVCQGVNSGSMGLISSSGNINGWIYSSNNGATWQTSGNTTSSFNYLNISSSTIYCAIVQSTGCPADTSVCDTVFITPLPIANAGVDDTIIIFDQTQLFGTGGVFYAWTPAGSLSDPTIADPIANPTTTTTYTLTVSDAFGCFGTDQVTIFVIDTTTPPMPNTIIIANYMSLNGDGLNDVWNIMNIEYFPENEVTVFNNQGMVVYEKSTYDNSWDGKFNGDQLPDGSYFYVVNLTKLGQKTKGVLTITSK
ncbi:MAG TPA: gliding motility-associated C-terminal domain-containing protein [Flavobacteriales bacterium]|nr:gliding motility-associated C-terminal domain-containing protein [Flavobacteriales bacterium]HRJ34603.1 gliding motility-associated C-terminal domain-containing protein [Flavobacteriales bacterium]HRJ39183.1 gliding motility-associated C-terminal domain-containing protein [Flavobacteriales bacterium]